MHLDLGGVFSDEEAAAAGLAEASAERSFLVEVQSDRTLRCLAPILTAVAA